MVRSWEDIVEAIGPGHAQYLATAGNAAGWLLCAWKLDCVPVITTRRVYRDDTRTMFIEYPFTIEELYAFLRGDSCVEIGDAL